MLQFGAVGDGTTNDTAAVLAALQSGFVVDGGGLTLVYQNSGGALGTIAGEPICTIQRVEG